MKAFVAVALALAAAAIWGWQFWQPAGNGEAVWGDTAGVTTEILKVDRVEHGYAVQCRVENHRTQPARQVVLTITLVDPSGNTVAANPLVSVASLNPAKPREIQVLVPTPKRVTTPHVKGEVTLVQWSN